MLQRWHAVRNVAVPTAPPSNHRGSPHATPGRRPAPVGVDRRRPRLSSERRRESAGKPGQGPCRRSLGKGQGRGARGPRRGVARGVLRGQRVRRRQCVRSGRVPAADGRRRTRLHPAGRWRRAQGPRPHRSVADRDRRVLRVRARVRSADAHRLVRRRDRLGRLRREGIRRLRDRARVRLGSRRRRDRGRKARSGCRLAG